ncbi:MAG: cytochrome c biogenesis protein CcsA [Candidatus Hodarchaeota archaeon]
MTFERIKQEYFLVILVLLSLFIIANYFVIFVSVEPFEGFTVSGHPIFYMIPFAFATYFCFALVLLSGILYLKKKKERYDLLLVSSAQIGILTGAITLMIGILWSYAEWGYFWQWEARQTATLIMWISYVALLILRGMFEDKDFEKRAVISATFGIVVSPSVPLSNFIVGALHPEPQQTTLGEGIGLILVMNFLFVLTVALILVYITYRMNKLDLMLKKVRMARMEAFY